MAAKPSRILIVDDEFSVRDSLYHWFRKDGYEVTAARAAEAVEALRSTAVRRGPSGHQNGRDGRHWTP